MTTWNLQSLENGHNWLAGQSGITAGMSTFDGKTVYAGSIGRLTTWTLQNKS
jgi:hypothetical protein